MNVGHSGLVSVVLEQRKKVSGKQTLTDDRLRPVE